MSVLLITEETKNAIKMQAIHAAATKVNRTYGDNLLTKTIALLDPVDVQPVRKEEAVAASEKIAMRLSEQYDQTTLKGYTDVLSMGIQKGVNLFDSDPDPFLFCIVSIYSLQQKKMYTVESKVAHLPLEARELVVTKKMNVYDAWGKLFGKEVQTKKISLYEKLTGKKEAIWIADTIVRGFDLLKK
jgi:hypothetical protein